MLRTIIYFHVYIILDFPLTYRNASVLDHSECACQHKTVNKVVLFAKSNDNTYPKGRALMQMYRVVLITKRGNKTLAIQFSCTCCYMYKMRHTCEQCIPLGPSYMYYTVVGDLIHDVPRAHSNTQPYDI